MNRRYRHMVCGWYTPSISEVKVTFLDLESSSTRANMTIGNYNLECSDNSIYFGPQLRKNGEEDDEIRRQIRVFVRSSRFCNQKRYKGRANSTCMELSSDLRQCLAVKFVSGQNHLKILSKMSAEFCDAYMVQYGRDHTGESGTTWNCTKSLKIQLYPF